MQRDPIFSSNIKSVGHDPATDTLEIEFNNGAVWQYAGVTAEQHANLLRAPSVGAHFAKHIRGKFEEKRI